MNISVVICCYTEDRWARLRAAVASVEAQHRPASETIVVVDHCDALLDRVRTELGSVVALANGERRGLSGARNTGVAAARGDVIAFLDDDAEADPDWLDRLAHHYRRPAVMGVGGAAVAVWPGRRPGWFPPEFDWVVGCSYQGLPAIAAEVRNLIGANMSFRRDVFRTTGGFDARLGRVATLPAGCEETEFCIRARLANPTAVIVYEPRAVVRHHVSIDRVGRRYFRSRCYREGISKAVLTKLGGSVTPLAVEARYVTRTLPRGAAAAIRSAARDHDPAGAARAGAIASGLLHTATGYAVGTTRSWLSSLARAGRAQGAPA